MPAPVVEIVLADQGALNGQELAARSYNFAIIWLALLVIAFNIGSHFVLTRVSRTFCLELLWPGADLSGIASRLCSIEPPLPMAS